MSDGNLKEENYNTEEIRKKAVSEMVRALNTYGCREVLELLVVYSHQDLIVRWLLEQYPAIVSLSEFLFEKPLVEIKEKSENFLNTTCPVLIRDKNEREGGENTPKKARSRKRRKADC